MSVRVSATTIFCIVSLFGASSALHAQTVGADRIYAAEAKAAALKAQNEQLRQSVATQSAALKRLDDEINLMQQDHDLQLKNLQSVQAAELNALRNNTSAQNTALREMNEKIKRCIEHSTEQALNESTLDNQARAAKAEAANLRNLLDQKSAQIAKLSAQITDLQTNLSSQSGLAEQAPELRKNFAKAVQDNKALRQLLARSEAERVQLKDMQTQQQSASSDTERLRAQLAFMQERNIALQEALSSAPPADQVQALQAALKDAQFQLAANNSSQQGCLEQAAMQSALNAANAQIQQDAQEIAALRATLNDAQEGLNQTSSLQRALNDAKAQILKNTEERNAFQQNLEQQHAQTTLDAARLESDHLTLQAEYKQLLDGVRSCEARLQNANQAAANAKQEAAQASSHPEDIRRIAELESALDRANIEIRNTNQAFEEELNLERAMAAGAEVELEQQYQKRINAMQVALQSCQAG